MHLLRHCNIWENATDFLLLLAAAWKVQRSPGSPSLTCQSFPLSLSLSMAIRSVCTCIYCMFDICWCFDHFNAGAQRICMDIITFWWFLSYQITDQLTWPVPHISVLWGCPIGPGADVSCWSSTMDILTIPPCQSMPCFPYKKAMFCQSTPIGPITTPIFVDLRFRLKSLTEPYCMEILVGTLGGSVAWWLVICSPGKTYVPHKYISSQFRTNMYKQFQIMYK